MYLKKLLKIISYGSFSLPFINFILENEPKDSALSNYMLSAKYTWTLDNKQSLYYTDKFINSKSSNNGIKYLIIAKKATNLNSLDKKKKL